jgi:3-hydroxy-9,10-secoandrosta-1,3,5(10)-triene-9,17-dione monooxygenase
VIDTTDMLEGARALVPGLRARREQSDALRRVPDETVAELVALGMLGAATPRELGGTDLGCDVLLDLAIEIGRGDGAAAWCGGNWAIHNLMMAMFPQAAQEEVFAKGLPIVSTGFSPARASMEEVDGGSVVTGQWDFASGVDHAGWVVVVAMSPTAGPLAHLVPVGDLTIVDTWFTGGLRGSGSKDVAASGVFVPAHRRMALGDAMAATTVGRELYDSPFFRVPMTAVFGVGVIGSILGMALGAIDVFTEATTAKVGGLSGVRVGVRPEVHHRLGETATEVDAAIAVTRRAFADIRLAGETEREITLADRLRWRRDIAWAAKVASEGVTRLFQVGGAHSLWMEDPLHQFYRDISAASHHYGMQWDVMFSAHGQFVLGIEPEVAML